MNPKLSRKEFVKYLGLSVLTVLMMGLIARGVLVLSAILYRRRTTFSETTSSKEHDVTKSDNRNLDSNGDLVDNGTAS